MLIFLDTEFTGLNQSDPKLISIGLVPADGRNEFYAEIEIGDGWTYFDCAEFVRLEVLPLLKGGNRLVTRAELRDKLLAWFATLPRNCQIACDSEIDMRLLRQALGDAWPANLAPKHFDLRDMANSTVFDRAVAEYFEWTNAKPHHALHDARANRKGWLAYCDARKNKP